MSFIDDLSAHFGIKLFPNPTSDDVIISLEKNNSVDIIYNFDVGEVAKIKKIIFIGNKIFRDSKLRNVIKSEEGKFW